MTRTLTRIAILAAVLLSVAAAAVGSAQAMSPAHTSAWTLANDVNYNLQTGATTYGSVEHFWMITLRAWGYNYQRPSVTLYGNHFGDRSTGCVHTSLRRNNGFYCPGDGGIYLDYEYMQSLVNGFGDFGAGGFMAHEWGHRSQHYLGYLDYGFRTEYHADCLAGMYTRWAYGIGKLTGGDYWEFSNWLSSQSPSGSHGSGANRAAWFRHGYTQYSLAACNQALTLTVAYAKGGKRVLRPNTKKRIDLTPGNKLPKGGPVIKIGGREMRDATPATVPFGFNSLDLVF